MIGYMRRFTYETNVISCNLNKAPKVKHGCLVCKKCATEIEVSSDQVCLHIVVSQ